MKALNTQILCSDTKTEVFPLKIKHKSSWLLKTKKIPCPLSSTPQLGQKSLEVATLTPWWMSKPCRVSTASSFKRQWDQHSPHSMVLFYHINNWKSKLKPAVWTKRDKGWCIKTRFSETSVHGNVCRHNALTIICSIKVTGNTRKAKKRSSTKELCSFTQFRGDSVVFAFHFRATLICQQAVESSRICVGLCEAMLQTKTLDRTKMKKNIKWYLICYG